MEGECVRRSGPQGREGVRAWFACHHPWYARAPATSCSFSGHISIRYTHTHTHTTTTMVMNTVFSKAFFFLLLVVGGSVNLASYGGLSSSLRLGPVGALASKAPKDMPLSDLPEEFWFNDVSGESQWEDPTVEYKDDEGNTYWVDPELGESVWTKPAAAAWEATESTDPDHNGQTYYYNTVTHESQWEKPKELAWRKVKTADSHGAEL